MLLPDDVALPDYMVVSNHIEVSDDMAL